jgi:selenide, water dikinase
MGATPLTALNIAGFPIEDHSSDLLAEILAGGAATAREAGTAILGGHTIKDDEPKYGMAVTGIVHPDRIVTNAGAQSGDLVFLTKPLGTGILASALKKDVIDARQIAEAVRWMTTLNAAASCAMLSAGVHAATDVTGYGLLGHAYEMASASRRRIRIDASRVPVLGLVRGLVAAGISPGGSRANAREHALFTDFAAGIDAETRLILSDAQTSGGLLIAVPAERAANFQDACRAQAVVAHQIGCVEDGEGLVVHASS